MLEACFPRAFVIKGHRTEWMVPLRHEVWDELHPLVVNEWGFDDATFYGVRSEYTNQYSYWEAMLKIGIRGDLTGLPSTAQGLREYIDKNPGVVVTKEERKKIKKLVVRWSLHHYPQPERAESKSEPKTEKPARKQYKQNKLTPVTGATPVVSSQSLTPPTADRQSRTKYSPTVIVKKQRQPGETSSQSLSQVAGSGDKEKSTTRKPGLLKLKKRNEQGSDDGGGNQ